MSSRACASATPRARRSSPARWRRCTESAHGGRSAIASSSNRELIDLVLEAGGLDVARAGRGLVGGGRPRQAGARRVPRGDAAARDRAAARAAVEDSHNGIRSAKAAGLRVVAIPNLHFPPDAESLALADVVLASIDELTVEVVAG